MEHKKKREIFITRDGVWSFFVALFFTICLNPDWNQSRLFWYGSIALLAVVYLITYNGRFLFKNMDFLIWFVALLGLCLLSLLWCLSVSPAMEIVKTLIVLLLVFSLLQFSVNFGFDLDKIVMCLFAAVLINMIYVVGTIDLAALGETQLGVELLEGWNGNAIGFMAAEGALAGFYMLGKSKDRLFKLLLLAAIAFLSIMTVYTGSRTAFVVLVGGFILYICIKNPTKLARNLLIAALLLFGAFYLMMNVESLYNVLGSRFEGLFALFGGGGEVDSSASIRDTFIENGVKWFSENPLLGYGINNYKVLNEGATGRFTYAHNTFIEIAVNLGLVGLFFYYTVYVKLAVRLWKRAKNNPLNAFLLASLLISLISQYGTVSYYGLYQNLLLFLCFAAIRRTKRKSELTL